MSDQHVLVRFGTVQTRKCGRVLLDAWIKPKWVGWHQDPCAVIEKGRSTMDCILICCFFPESICVITIHPLRNVQQYLRYEKETWQIVLQMERWRMPWSQIAVRDIGLMNLGAKPGNLEFIIKITLDRTPFVGSLITIYNTPLWLSCQWVVFQY